MKFAFLVYVARSGSTLLARHLDALSGSMLVTPEFRLIEMLMIRDEKRICRLTPVKLLKLFQLDFQIDNLGLSPEELERVAQRCAGKGSRALIEELLLRHAEKRGSSPSLMVIKNGFLLHVHQRLREVFPEAAFIHVYRDGRGVVNSLIHSRDPLNFSRHMGRGDAVFCARHWSAYLEKTDRLAAPAGASVLNVRYEDFVERPSDVVRSLGSSLSRHFGMPLKQQTAASTFKVPEQERALHPLVEQSPVEARTHAWKTELNWWQGVAVEHFQREALARYGYRPHFLVGISRGRVTRAVALAELTHLFSTFAHYVHWLMRLVHLILSDRQAARTKISHALNRLFARV